MTSKVKKRRRCREESKNGGDDKVKSMCTIFFFRSTFFLSRISSLPLTVFGEMHSLDHIFLGNNKLEHLMRDVFQPIIDNVQIIDVQGKKKRMKMEMYMFSCELLLCVEKKTFIIFFVILPIPTSIT